MGDGKLNDYSLKEAGEQAGDWNFLVSYLALNL
jgi:hypothetical protein